LDAYPAGIERGFKLLALPISPLSLSVCGSPVQVNVEQGLPSGVHTAHALIPLPPVEVRLLTSFDVDARAMNTWLRGFDL
jgi:hypothetical protein